MLITKMRVCVVQVFFKAKSPSGFSMVLYAIDEQYVAQLTHLADNFL